MSGPQKPISLSTLCPASITIPSTSSVLTMFLCVGRSSSDGPTASRPLYTAGRGWVREKKGAEWVEERARCSLTSQLFAPSLLHAAGDGRSVKGLRGVFLFDVSVAGTVSVVRQASHFGEVITMRLRRGRERGRK